MLHRLYSNDRDVAGKKRHTFFYSLSRFSRLVFRSSKVQLVSPIFINDFMVTVLPVQVVLCFFVYNKCAFFSQCVVSDSADPLRDIVSAAPVPVVLIAGPGHPLADSPQCPANTKPARGS